MRFPWQSCVHNRLIYVQFFAIAYSQIKRDYKPSVKMKAPKKLIVKLYTLAGGHGAEAWIHRAWVNHLGVVVKFQAVSPNFGNDSRDWIEFNPGFYPDRYFYQNRRIEEDQANFDHAFYEGMKFVGYRVITIYP